MDEFLKSDANLIALCVFIVMGGVGAILAHAFAQKGDRKDVLLRRMRYAGARQGEDPVLAAEILSESEVFGDMEEKDRNDQKRFSRIRDHLDREYSLIGGVAVLRKAVPVAAIAGFVVALVALAKLQLPFQYAAMLGFGVAVGGLFLGLRIVLRRTYEKFSLLFPEAIDLVVRSVRAGLPVSQALENIGVDIAAPVGPEFARISGQMGIGVSLDDALHESLDRIDLPEMRFFAVTLILQRETGGQLAEVLLNLSDTLRQRKAMKMKIQALTSESRAASKIVAAIPVLAGVGMYYLNKPSMMLLFETPTGNNMLIYSVGSIFIGLMIIKKLTAVDA